MRIALFVPGGVDRSGTHRVIPVLLWLLERITPHHDVHVFALRGEGTGDRYELRGATVHDVVGEGRRTLPTLRAFSAEHRRAPFDLLHAFWVTGPGVVAGLAGLLKRRPMLLHIPGGDLVAIPTIGYGGRLTWSGRLRASFALAAATRRTAPSEAVCRQARALGHRTERLPLGVCRRAWPPESPAPRLPGEPARLVHVATLNRVKDQATLLRAAKRMARAGLDFTLDVVGEDILGGEIQRMARESGIGERVRFHGFLPHERLRPLLSGAHLMLISSLHEAGPVVAVEGAMTGVPTVGTAMGTLEEWAPDAAAVVLPGDDGALARTALDLLADEEGRRRMAMAAQGRALAEDADWSAAQVLKLYDELKP